MRDIHTTVIGNATAAPSIHDHPDGSSSTSVRIAVTGSYFDRSKGEFVDRPTEFITVYARRTLGENVAASVRKGQPLIVTGRLGSSEWVDKDGVTRFSLTLWAESIGHDLRYGKALFTKPTRAGDVPVFDAKTGEVMAESVSEGPEDHEGAQGGDEDVDAEGADEKELASTSPF